MKPPDVFVKPDRIQRLEWILALLLAVAIIALMAVRGFSAGALWRDQCGTTQLALMPLGELLRNFDHQTLPPLLPLVYRLYLKSFGSADSTTQWFRLIAAAALIGAALVGRRMNRGQPPLFLLALFGLNSVFLYWGGYTVTAVSIAFVSLLAAGLLLEPGKARAAGFAIAAFISVQLLINNLLLLMVLSTSAIIACLFRLSYKLALFFASVLIVCALSDVVYLHIYAAADWRILLKRPMTFAWLWPQVRGAFGMPPWLTLSLWFAVFVATLAAAGWRLFVAWRGSDESRCRLSIFAILVGFAAPTAYCSSFLLSGIGAAESRHFLPMLAVLAPNFDLIVTHLANQAWARLLRIALSVAVLAIVPFASWKEITQRQTNIDLVAQKIEQEAGSGDLVIVNPWSVGISFDRYYHGPARWLTVPNISDHRIHRYDLVKEKMMSATPLEDLKHEIVTTLHGGNRVWVVGTLAPPENPGVPLFPFPAPDPEFGWQHMIYREAWTRQLRDFMNRHARQARCLIEPMANVNPLENVPLWLVDGENQGLPLNAPP